MASIQSTGSNSLFLWSPLNPSKGKPLLLLARSDSFYGRIGASYHRESRLEELLADLLVRTESRNDDTRSIAKNLKTNADAIYECLGNRQMMAEHPTSCSLKHGNFVAASPLNKDKDNITKTPSRNATRYPNQPITSLERQRLFSALPTILTKLALSDRPCAHEAPSGLVWGSLCLSPNRVSPGLTVHSVNRDEIESRKTGDFDRRLCFSSGTTAIHANPLKSTRRAFQVPSRKPLGTACPAATAR
ncbi:Uncharacterized protein LW94_10422 [Fusarium fujikuroi]|nr:Uncharacterized protein LW94_10422 [Fusarium fujikuroi]